MSGQHGAISISGLRLAFGWLALWLPLAGHAVSVGNLTFSLAADADFVAKRVVNNNQSTRLYRVAVTEIDRPGSGESQSRPADGELLFAPRQLSLRAGEGEYFKFYYHGPRDGRERYYRVSFREIPTRSEVLRNGSGAAISMDPVVILDTILVVRPREVRFKWTYSQAGGTVSNVGNTWFKLLGKPGCDSTEEEGGAWYLRPGDTVRSATLRQAGNHYIVYDDRFIRVTNDCPAT